MADVKMSDMTADTTIAGTEKLLGLDATTNKTITVDQIVAYSTAELLSSTAQASFLGTDDILAERSDAAAKIPASAMATYVIGSAFDSTLVTSASSGDLLVLERAGVAKTISVDNLKTYVEPSQESLLDVSELTAATLGGTDTLLVCQGTTPLKTTLTDLESQLWSDLDAHVTGLAAVTATADSDVFHVNQGGTEKKVTASTLATYFQSENASAIVATAWDAVSVESAASGDVLVLERSGVLKTIDVNAVGDHAVARLGAKASVYAVAAGDDFPLYRDGTPGLVDIEYLTDYILDATWDASAVTTLETTDEVAVGRSGDTKKITFANLVTEIQADILAAASDASSLGATDQYLVVQSGTTYKTTLSDLETKLWADRLTHVSGLAAVTTVADTDIFHVNQGGVSKKVTPVELATYVKGEVESDILDSAWDATAVTTAASGDIVILQRSGVLKTMDVDAIATHAITTLGSSAAGSTITAGDDFVLYRDGSPKLGDIDDMVAYVLVEAFDATAVESAATGDLIVIERAGNVQTIDVDDLKTYVGTASLNVSGLSAATLTATDEYLVCQSGAPKKTTLTALETKLWGDFATYAGALTAATSVVDADKFYMLHAGTPQHVSATTLATYAEAELWGNAAAVTSFSAADKFLLQQSGTTVSASYSSLSTSILTGAQATILNISGLGAATLGTTDLVPVCQGTTAKKTTVAALMAATHGALSTYTGALDAVTATADTDKLYCVQGGVAKYVTPLVMADYCYDYVVDELVGLDAKNDPVANDTMLLHDSESSNALKVATISNLAEAMRWKKVVTTKYTAIPASTSSITMSDTGDMAVGLPVRYTYNGSTYYGIVSAVSASASITVNGAPLNTAHALTALEVGTPEMVKQVDFHIEADYDGTAQNILATIGKKSYKWFGGDAYLVAFSAAHATADTGATQPYLNVKIGGSLVSTNATNNGLQLSGTANTWVNNSAVAISASNYDISHGDAVEIACTVIGTNGDADNLSVSCLFVYE